MKKHIASILFLFLLSTFQLIAQSHSCLLYTSDAADE